MCVGLGDMERSVVNMTGLSVLLTDPSEPPMLCDVAARTRRHREGGSPLREHLFGLGTLCPRVPDSLSVWRVLEFSL